MKNITFFLALSVIVSATTVLSMKRLPENSPEFIYTKKLCAYNSPEKQNNFSADHHYDFDLDMNLWGSPRRDASQTEDYDLNCTITNASEHIKLEHPFDKILRRSSFSIAYEKIINAEDIETEENLFQPSFADKATAIALSLPTQTITNTENIESEDNYGKAFSYRCTFKGCNKSFTNKSKRDQHRRTHNNKPYICPIEGCNKSYTQQHNLTTHMDSHTNATPYTCSVEECKKTFADKNNYQRHMRIHTGEKPFACTFEGCNKKFSRSDDATKHMRTHINP